MYHVSAQGIDERVINVHYYYWHGCNLLLNFVHHAKLSFYVRGLRFIIVIW